MSDWLTHRLASWAAMVAQYPPWPAGEESEPQADQESARSEVIALILERTPDAPSDLTSDVNWVYSHLGDKAIAPVDFPSLGTWSLWQWARENSNRFFEQLLPRALAARQKRETEDAVAREEHARIEELRQMADEMHVRSAKALAEGLGRDVRRAAWTKISDLKEWERQFRLPATPQEAVAALRSKMAELAKGYMAEAVTKAQV